MLHDVAGLEQAMQHYLDVQAGIVKKKQLDALGLGIITDNLFQNYNVHAYLDTHVKAMLLGWGNHDKFVQMIRPGEPIHNPVMLEYWRQYITVIEDEEAIEQLTPLRAYLENDLSLAANMQGKAVYIEHAKAIVQREWERQGR